ncbi:MAG: hypothetical protein ACRD9R_22300 [Pyrinomonadaceae bacterium]
MRRAWRAAAARSLLVLFTLIVPFTRAQSATADRLARCADQLVPYADWPKVKDPTFSLNLQLKPQGRLFYYGAQHSSDPTERQFREIEEAWNRLKPTVAFYEGPNRSVAATHDEAIKQTGESGFVRFLAARDGVPFVTLEPSPKEEAAHVTAKFGAEQAALFFVLREASRLRERRKMGEPEIKAAIAQLLERAKPLGIAITNLEELDAAYKRHWKSPAEWWQSPTAWFDPLKTSAETGGLFTNDINRASSEYRNLHMYRLLAGAAREGKTAFAVVGRNHVPMQAAALRCALLP